MKIGLIDVDGTGKFPNIALMKISSYHKRLGHSVEWCNPMLRYDKVYMSKIFDFTPGFTTYLNAKEIIKGGIAYGLENKLPYDIEHIYPDYSLYSQFKDTAYGFMSRGCPRDCDFCNVSQHQGKKSIKVANLNEFWNGQKNIVLLDPNILACENKFDILQQLIDSNAYIDFSQGLDIRMITEKSISYINKLKIKMIHFAWDNYEFKTYEKLKYYRNKFIFNERKLRVYVLVNFNTTIEQDLDRIYKLRELKYDPYIMIYDKPKANKEIKRIARWVNNKFIWRTCERFEDYQKG